MTLGLDYAWERPDPAALAAAGYTFACRYLSYDTTGKNLTATEAQALHAAGLSIVLNWEYDPQAALRGFLQGHDDAVAAAAQREAVGAPNTVPVYFSVDFGATAAQMAEILSYVAGCVSVLGYDGVGVYGSFTVVDTVRYHNACRWTWQTYAWSSGAWQADANIRQTANGVPFNGVTIDQDESMTVDFGQWKVEGLGMTDYGFSDPSYGDRAAWRLDAMAKGTATVNGGPSAGEEMALVQIVKDTQSMAANTNAAISALQSAVTTLTTQVAALTTKVGAQSGTVHVSGDLTVGQ